MSIKRRFTICKNTFYLVNVRYGPFSDPDEKTHENGFNKGVKLILFLITRIHEELLKRIPISEESLSMKRTLPNKYERNNRSNL